MREPCNSDAAAYVLGALDRDELDAFRVHLNSCAVCRDEVAALQPVADTLGAAVPHHVAPRALKRNLMSKVREEQRATVRMPRRRRLVLAPALAMLVVGLIVGATTLNSSTATRVTHGQNTSAPGAVAEIISYGSRGQLHVSGMPAAPHGHVYEIWERVGKRVEPTDALFNVTRAGSATASVPGNLGHVNTVMVTAEPDGGSQVPTSAPVVVVTL